jgi:hypothetical protein
MAFLQIMSTNIPCEFSKGTPASYGLYSSTIYWESHYSIAFMVSATYEELKGKY